MEEIVAKIRRAEEEDFQKFPVVSYSRLDVLNQCLYRFYWQYKKKLKSKKSAIALDVGTLVHSVLEDKGKTKINKTSYDYPANISCAKQKVAEIQKKYFDEWIRPDNKSGMSYPQKFDVFFNEVLPTRMEETDWEVIATEQKFSYVWNERVIIQGFIDRVDKNTNSENMCLRVTDYKTSKAAYDESKLKTPLQMVVYALACQLLYGTIPEKFEYDFVLVNEKREACSKGYLKRGITKLDKLLDCMFELESTGKYYPKPSPLCHWCSYCATNSAADLELQNICKYYSEWTPENKTFSTNKAFDKESFSVNENTERTKRKLIF